MYISSLFRHCLSPAVSAAQCVKLGDLDAEQDIYHPVAYPQTQPSILIPDRQHMPDDGRKVYQAPGRGRLVARRVVLPCGRYL